MSSITVRLSKAERKLTEHRRALAEAVVRRLRKLPESEQADFRDVVEEAIRMKQSEAMAQFEDRVSQPHGAVG